MRWTLCGAMLLLLSGVSGSPARCAGDAAIQLPQKVLIRDGRAYAATNTSRDSCPLELVVANVRTSAVERFVLPFATREGDPVAWHPVGRHVLGIATEAPFQPGQLTARLEKASLDNLQSVAECGSAHGSPRVSEESTSITPLLAAMMKATHRGAGRLWFDLTADEDGRIVLAMLRGDGSLTILRHVEGDEWRNNLDGLPATLKFWEDESGELRDGDKPEGALSVLKLRDGKSLRSPFRGPFRAAIFADELYIHNGEQLYLAGDEELSPVPGATSALALVIDERPDAENRLLLVGGAKAARRTLDFSTALTVRDRQTVAAGVDRKTQRALWAVADP